MQKRPSCTPPGVENEFGVQNKRFCTPNPVWRLVAKLRGKRYSIFLRLKMIQMATARQAIRMKIASQAHHFPAKGRVTFMP